MERNYNVAHLHNPMWLLIPILCFLQTSTNHAGQFIPESPVPNNNGVQDSTNLTKSLDRRLNHDNNEFLLNNPIDGNLNDSGSMNGLEIQGDSDESLFLSDSDLIITSDPVVEEIPDNTLLLPNRRRDLPDRGFLNETKEMILQLHNSYRGKVTPPAGDMGLLEWDAELGHLAQLWADGCAFKHGNPSKPYSGGFYGQNIYYGSDPTGSHGIRLWFDEYNYYDFDTLECDPKEQCGHYVTMAWAMSLKLGCGVTKCGLRYLVVCHYFPGAVRGKKIYTVGRPCSQCPSEDGSLCLQNICVTWEQCNRNPRLCDKAECNLKCRNCGRLDENKCKCECADGWDSPDCSRMCMDEHERCGISPGFPNQNSCYLGAYMVGKKHCRKMCQSCNTVNKESKDDEVCCYGKLCKFGHILETKSCTCEMLCPGPKCNYTASGISLSYNFVSVVLFVTVTRLYMFSL